MKLVWLHCDWCKLTFGSESTFLINALSNLRAFLNHSNEAAMTSPVLALKTQKY